MNTFFTADTHFSHSGIIHYCNRPFSSFEEMNETIIQNWNNKVQPKDTVYHLGDFAFGQRAEILSLTKRLNGHIILIEGNHDNIGQPKNYGFSEKYPIREIKLEGHHITLNHYAMRVWNKSHYDSWHLYGHSHSTLEPIGKSWDIGVDNNKFFPLSFDEIKKIMDNQPHNFNWVSRLPGYTVEAFEQARIIEEMK